MLRTRLFFGLLPLLLVIVGTGAYAIRVCHQLAGPLEGDLVAALPRRRSGCQDMRTTATLMSNALAFAGADPIGARRQLDDAQVGLHARAHGPVGKLRGHPSGASRGTARRRLPGFLPECDRMLAAGWGRIARRDPGQPRTPSTACSEPLDRLTPTIMRPRARPRRRRSSSPARRSGFCRLRSRWPLRCRRLLAWMVAASLLKPIKALTASATALGEGNLDTHGPGVLSGRTGQPGPVVQHDGGEAPRVPGGHRRAGAEDAAHHGGDAHLGAGPPFRGLKGGELIEVRNPAAEELSKAAGILRRVSPRPSPSRWPSVLGDRRALPADRLRAYVVTFRVGREDRHYLPRILAIGDKLTEFKGAAVILQDVTKFRLLDDAKTNLVGTVSHELKTPLTGLRMAVYLLLEKTLGPLSRPSARCSNRRGTTPTACFRILDSLLDLNAPRGGGVRARARTGSGRHELIERDRRRGPGRSSRRRARALSCAPSPGSGSVSVDAGPAPARFHQPALKRLEVLAGVGATITLSARLRTPLGFVRFFGPRRGLRGSQPEAIPACLRPILPGARPVQAGRRDRPGYRPRDRGRPRGKRSPARARRARGRSSTS
jgi:two-component system, NtrC family, sensor histidine kinase KinB